MAKPLVYIAAPYTHPDPVENTHHVVKVATTLVEDDVVTPIVPHATLLWHAITPRPVEFWYRYDLEVMRRCDAVLRLPGESHGADVEVMEAMTVGIPVFLFVESLYEWAAAGRPS